MMFFMNILLYILGFFGFVTFLGCAYMCWKDEEYDLVWFFASVPVVSVIAWFVFPAHHIWVVGVNCLIMLLIIGGLLLEAVSPAKVKLHFMIKRLLSYYEAGDTEHFEELYQKVSEIADVQFPTIRSSDRFRYIMLKYEIGKYNEELDYSALFNIVCKAEISKADYEKYQEQINRLEYEKSGAVYGYGTDRNCRSKSGVWDIWRFRSRILS